MSPKFYPPKIQGHSVSQFGRTLGCLQKVFKKELIKCPRPLRFSCTLTHWFCSILEEPQNVTS